MGRWLRVTAEDVEHWFEHGDGGGTDARLWRMKGEVEWNFRIEPPDDQALDWRFSAETPDQALDMADDGLDEYYRRQDLDDLGMGF